MTVQVTIVDYGSSNMYSVRRAFEHCGAEPLLADGPAGVEQAERLVLPGVGAFADGMRGLQEIGVVEALREFARSGRPLLGICVGMQLLATEGEEFGLHEGLDIIPGRVVQVPATDVSGTPQRIPYVGWTDLEPAAGFDWRGTFLESLTTLDSVYAVHSFHVLPDDPLHLLADYDYGGHRVTAAIHAGSVVGCQFHPEKSGPAGLRLLESFLQR